MTEEEFDSLTEGDVIRGKASGLGYIVQAKLKGAVVAFHSVTATQPGEWDLVCKFDAKEGYEKEPPIELTGKDAKDFIKKLLDF